MDFIVAIFAIMVSLILTLFAYSAPRRQSFVFFVASATWGILFLGYSFKNYTSITFAGSTIPMLLFAVGVLFIAVLMPVMALISKSR